MTYPEALQAATDYFLGLALIGQYSDPVKCQTWGNEFVDYYLVDDETTGPYFTKESVEITTTPIFRFIVPETKEEFFTLLNILDK